MHTDSYLARVRWRSATVTLISLPPVCSSAKILRWTDTSVTGSPSSACPIQHLAMHYPPLCITEDDYRNMLAKEKNLSRFSRDIT